jgi:hypothetical protein
MIKWNRPGYFIPATLEEEAHFWYSQARAQEIEIEIIESPQDDPGEDLEGVVSPGPPRRIESSH